MWWSIHIVRHGSYKNELIISKYSFSPWHGEVFPSPAGHWGGGGVPPGYLPIAGPILDPKTPIVSLEFEFLNMPQKFFSGYHWWRYRSGQSSDFWLSVIAGFAGQSSRIRLRQCRWNGIDRLWHTSKYHPKSCETMCQINVIQGHEAKKVRFKSLGGLVHVLGQIFVKNTKMTP